MPAQTPGGNYILGASYDLENAGTASDFGAQCTITIVTSTTPQKTIAYGSGQVFFGPRASGVANLTINSEANVLTDHMHAVCTMFHVGTPGALSGRSGSVTTVQKDFQPAAQFNPIDMPAQIFTGFNGPLPSPHPTPHAPSPAPGGHTQS